MGLFSLLKKIKEAGEFTPDFNKSEYDNWLNYLDKGGNSKEWEALKKANGWKFKRSKADKLAQFEKEFRPLWNAYYASVQKLKADWSVMYNAKNYTGKRAESFERNCLNNIAIYKAMAEVEDKYGQDHLTIVEGYKRLAMLFEKQGEYEKCISICKEAISYGNFEDAKGRLARAIKKANKTPTAEETALINN